MHTAVIGRAGEADAVVIGIAERDRVDHRADALQTSPARSANRILADQEVRLAKAGTDWLIEELDARAHDVGERLVERARFVQVDQVGCGLGDAHASIRAPRRRASRPDTPSSAPCLRTPDSPGTPLPKYITPTPPGRTRRTRTRSRRRGRRARRSTGRAVFAARAIDQRDDRADHDCRDRGARAA